MFVVRNMRVCSVKRLDRWAQQIKVEMSECPSRACALTTRRHVTLVTYCSKRCRSLLNGRRYCCVNCFSAVGCLERCRLSWALSTCLGHCRLFWALSIVLGAVDCFGRCRLSWALSNILGAVDIIGRCRLSWALSIVLGVVDCLGRCRLFWALSIVLGTFEYFGRGQHMLGTVDCFGHCRLFLGIAKHNQTWPAVKYIAP